MIDSDRRETFQAAKDVTDLPPSLSSPSIHGARHPRSTQRASLHSSVNGRASLPLAPHPSAVPPTPGSRVQSDLFQLLLSSRRPIPTLAAIPTPAYPQVSLREQLLTVLGDGSNGGLRQTFSAATPSSGYRGPTNDLRPSLQLTPEEQSIVAMIQGRFASLPVPGSPSLDQQLTSLMNEQRAQQVLAALAASINTASRYPSNLPAEPPQSRQPTLEHVQLHPYLLAQLQRNASLQSYPVQARDSSFGSLMQGLAAPPSPSAPAATTFAPIPYPPNSGHGNQQESFPAKLYRLLANVERQGKTHIVSFTPDGRAFKIHDPNAFVEEVAPDYFRQSHITSFVRQLNFYGFDRVSHGPVRGAFAHPSFLRGRPELLDSIQRQIVPPRAKKT
jgi:hypothetical protein